MLINEIQINSNNFTKKHPVSLNNLEFLPFIDIAFSDLLPTRLNKGNKPHAGDEQMLYNEHV